MTVQDDTLAADPRHAVALAVGDLIRATDDLCRALPNGISFDDLMNIEQIHATLGFLLDTRKNKKAVR